MSSVEVLDVMLRSGAAGVCIALAAILSRAAISSQPARFCVLFTLGAASYALASSPVLQEVMPAFTTAAKPFAIMSPVFFWWFGLSLFCDIWRWKPIHLTPLIIGMICLVLEWAGASTRVATIANLTSEAVHVLLVLHVMHRIHMGSGDDLVEPRRRVRGWWMGAIGVSIIGAVVVSALRLNTAMPTYVLTLESVGLLISSCLIAAWALSPREDFFPARAKPDAGPVMVDNQAADRRLIERLRTAMAEEIYRTAGLTVGRLSDQLGVREHRLRVVINRQLGYRNFAAFLNEYRIKAAKIALSDPHRAEEQILHIALDLGYGSIAPFNRAFRDLTGETPTGYRRKSLAEPYETPPPAAAE